MSPRSPLFLLAENEAFVDETYKRTNCPYFASTAKLDCSSMVNGVYPLEIWQRKNEGYF